MEAMKGPPPVLISIHDEVDGKPIGPSRVPIELLREFTRDVETFLKGSGEVIDDSVVRIVEGSLGIVPHEPTESLRNDLAVLEGMLDLSSIDPARANVVLKWQRAAKRSPTRHYWLADHERGHVSAITADSQFYVRNAGMWVAVRRRILGEIEDMGGASSPNIHVLTATGKIIVQASKEQIAEQRENKVYKRCLITILAEEHLHTGALRNVRLLSFDDYAPQVRDDSISRLRESGSKAWDGVDADAWVRKHREG